MLVKHEAKSSALLALRLHFECLISHTIRVRQCFSCFQEFPLLFQLIYTCVNYCNLPVMGFNSELIL